jgi:hypothetical protein
VTRPAEPHGGSERVEGTGLWVVLGSLALVVILNVGVLGSDAWRFRPGEVHARGILAPIVRAAHGEWDVGMLRSAAMLAGFGVAVLAVVATLVRSWPRWTVIVASIACVAALVLPPVALQAGLRRATAPWFFTNDSTYQIELAGDDVLHGRDPYGRDWSHSGLERFYSLDGSVRPGTRERQVALHHFAYFPGTPVLAAGWRALPAPFDDFRFLVALATLGLFVAALAFPGPTWARVALGTLAAANPILVRGAWFGTADAPSLLFLVLSFAAALGGRAVLAGALIGAAVATKQFALAAVPFLGALVLARLGRDALVRAGVAGLGVVAIVFLPFAVAGPGDLWRDTVSYGASTYRIVGYGLSAILLRLDVLDDRTGPYPFVPLALLVWLPTTVLLLRAQLRTPALWLAGSGFTASVFLLLFLGRVFQISYLAWPLTGLVLAGLLAAAARPT